jgi:hypothetical protein
MSRFCWEDISYTHEGILIKLHRNVNHYEKPLNVHELSLLVKGQCLIQRFLKNTCLEQNFYIFILLLGNVHHYELIAPCMIKVKGQGHTKSWLPFISIMPTFPSTAFVTGVYCNNVALVTCMSFFSLPEHNVLVMSYCDGPVSVEFQKDKRVFKKTFLSESS